MVPEARQPRLSGPALYVKSTLGFLPLYPLAIRGLASVFAVSPLEAALLISFAGGLIAAVLVQRAGCSVVGGSAGPPAVFLLASGLTLAGLMLP